MGYRDFYDKDYNYFYNYYIKFHCPYLANRYAKRDVRMYANHFCRDMRKKYLNKQSKCKICGSTENLQIDHIIPISKNGKNEETNIQILCSKCNRKKSDKIIL